MNTQAQDITVWHSKGAGRPIVDRFDFLCIVALIFSFLLVSRLPAAPSKYGDVYFHDEAKALAHAMRGAGPWSEVTFARAPGPALYYAVPYLFLQPNAPDDTYWRAALVWNALWMAVAILLIRRSGEYLQSELAGKIAGVFALMVPFGVYYSFGVAAETPAYVATAIFIFGWAHWRRLPDARLLSPAAFVALLGLFWLILCRPNALVLAGIAGTGYAGMLLVQRGAYRAVDKRFAIFGSVAGIAIFLLASFALKHMSGNRGVSSQASNLDEVVFLSDFQFRTEPWDWRFWGKATRQGSVDYENYSRVHVVLAQQSASTGVPIPQLQLDWTRRDVLDHPWVHLKMSVVRFLSLNVWLVNSMKPSAFHLGRFRGATVYWIFHFVLNAIALIPALLSICFLILNRKQFLAYWPVWGLWIGLLLFHALTYAEPRYMLPAQPGLSVMAACIVGSTIRRKTVAATATSRDPG